MSPRISALPALAGFSLLLAACNPFSSGKSGDGDPDPADTAKTPQPYSFAQGKFLATGDSLDLALEGEGLFILKEGAGHAYFRRPARFSRGADGYLYFGEAARKLQGVRLYGPADPYPAPGADSGKAIAAGDLSDVGWTEDDEAPAIASTGLRVTGNLDSEPLGPGGVLVSMAFLHHAESGDLLTGMISNDGTELGIKAGDVLTFSVNAGGEVRSGSLTVASSSTYGDLAAALTAFLRQPGPNAGLGTTVEPLGLPDSGAGALAIYGNSNAIAEFKLTSNRASSSAILEPAFKVDPIIPAGTTRLAATTTALRAPAVAADPVSELFNAHGHRFGLEAGDPITLKATRGGEAVAAPAPLIYAGGPAGLKMGALLDWIRKALALAEKDGSAENLPSVSLNAAGSEDSLRDGAIVVRGRPGIDNAIRDLVIKADDLNGTQPAPNGFNTGMTISDARKPAQDAVGLATAQAYDGTGKTLELSLRFAPTGAAGEWAWEASAPPGAKFTKGSAGTLKFAANGTAAAFLTDAGDAKAEVDPGNGSAALKLVLSAEVTRLRSATALALSQAGGIRSGTLRSVALGADGIVTGTYANGKSRPLYRIPLAAFKDPTKLARNSQGLFAETAGSRTPAYARPGGAVRLLSKSLEYVGDAELASACALFPAGKPAGCP